MAVLSIFREDRHRHEPMQLLTTTQNFKKDFIRPNRGRGDALRCSAETQGRDEREDEGKPESKHAPVILNEEVAERCRMLLLFSGRFKPWFHPVKITPQSDLS
jgi:hypothetical protein